jgi:hypothetical protein
LSTAKEKQGKERIEEKKEKKRGERIFTYQEL